jgi:hypothetical protein
MTQLIIHWASTNYLANEHQIFISQCASTNYLANTNDTIIH